MAKANGLNAQDSMRCLYQSSARWRKLLLASFVVLCVTFVASQGYAVAADNQQCLAAGTGCFSLAKKWRLLNPSNRYDAVTFFAVKDGETVSRRVTVADSEVLAIIEAAGTVLRHPTLQRFGVVLVELTEGVGPECLPALLFGTSVVTSSAETGTLVYSTGAVDQVLVNEVIVRFKTGTDTGEIEELLSAFGAQRVSEALHVDGDLHVVTFPGKFGNEIRVASNQLDRHDKVLYAQPNFIVVASRMREGGLAGLSHPFACQIEHCPEQNPEDGSYPHFLNPWYLNRAGYSGEEHEDVDAANAQKVTDRKDDIIIAMIDDGVEVHHKDLQTRIHSTWNAHTQNSGLDLKDSDKHGTAAAGVAVAVAPNAQIMSVRVFDWTADGYAYYPHSVVARGIKKAADTADVLSMGWTLGVLPYGAPIVEDAIDYALSKNRVLVFAAGNLGGPVEYPATLSVTKPIIAVSATDEWDKLVTDDLERPCDWGSNYGPEINVAAPGVNLYTTDRMGGKGYCASGDYTVSFGGTSGAAALVAGAAALILSREPDLSPEEVRQRLQTTADDLGEPGFDAKFGHGRINICRALQGLNCERTDVPHQVY